MLDTVQILTALENSMKSTFPGLKVLNRPERQGFKRAAVFIEHIRTSERGDNARLVDCTGYWLITLFPELDEYNDCDRAELLGMQDKALRALRCGHLAAGDRALSLQASTGGSDNDRAYIDIQLNYFDDRGDTADTEPLMSSVHYNIKEQSYGTA